jgi:hypothetical protein
MRALSGREAQQGKLEQPSTFSSPRKKLWLGPPKLREILFALTFLGVGFLHVRMEDLFDRQREHLSNLGRQGQARIELPGLDGVGGLS